MRFSPLLCLALLVGCETRSPALEISTVPVQVSDMATGETLMLNATECAGWVISIYRPVGGDLFFEDCFVDTGLNGECTDENGGT